MGAKGEMLAKQFEAKAQEATSAIEKLGEADWKKVTAAEQWPVGVVAHHIAASHATLAGLVKQLADGTLGAAIPMDALHAMNAKHAQDFANCTKAETVALHKTNASAAATTLRGIADADYERSGAVLVGLPAMSAGQVAGILCKHVDEHLGSIKATMGA
jgi:DinB superfamily